MSNTNIAMVIGNGESRKNIDLKNYKDYVLIGCNAIHRDYAVDHLVCCDQRMVREALTNDKISNIHTRSRYFKDFKKLQKQKSVRLLPEIPYQGQFKADKDEHWGSGPYAVLLACELGFDQIHMIGFDLYGRDHRVNNIYKNTNHYLKDSALAVDPAFWIYQIKKVFSIFDDRQFFVYNLPNWKMPESWCQPNVSYFELKNLPTGCTGIKYAVQ